jgi:hypothetical protein
MLTRDQKIAFAEFLSSERSRHLEDIDMIDEKLEALAYMGIVPKGEAPWVSTEDLEIEEMPDFCLANSSPFGGYWRYALDKAFENSTGEDNDGYWVDEA